MKRSLINLGAIIVAFIIGVAINNSCADSLENMSDKELRKLVLQLQEEIKSLKSRVAKLEGKTGSSSSSGSTIGGGYAFVVDGIHFNMDGTYCDPKDYAETVSSYQIINGVRIDSTYSAPSRIVSYIYDSYGRLTRTIQDNYEQRYSYSNKTVFISSIFSYNEPLSNGMTESGSTTAIHLK